MTRQERAVKTLSEKRERLVQRVTEEMNASRDQRGQPALQANDILQRWINLRAEFADIADSRCDEFYKITDLIAAAERGEDVVLAALESE